MHDRSVASRGEAHLPAVGSHHQRFSAPTTPTGELPTNRLQQDDGECSTF